jgi:ATP-dependent DNA helicase RecG
MEIEHTQIEYKSLKKAYGAKANLKELAETCVCLANAQGGMLYIGVDDKDKLPPENQKISQKMVNDVLSRLRSLTDSVGLGDAIIETHENGWQYFHFKVLATSRTIATTSSGKIILRIQDKCYPISGEEVTRLAAEKNAFQWELIELKSFKINQIPQNNISSFVNDIRKSNRVKESIKQKDDFEIIEHYNLVINGHLTNLGALWLGTEQMRSRISYPITIQYIVYDEYGEKIKKENWNDYAFNPKDLIIDVEEKASELKYFYEFPQGLFRKRIKQYAPEVIRELLINSIAHKKYTISGDIFLEVYPNRIEITNPGNLPIGITEKNILHSRHRRNPHLIRIFHDLNLMEGEGSGYDLIYELDSKDNKPFPIVKSDFDYTKVIQSSEIIDEEVVFLLEYISQHYQLSQKQFIALGIIAREKKSLGTELIKQLQLQEDERLRSYVVKLEKQQILISRGVRKGKQYLINPELLKSSKLNIKPSLKTIEPHRLIALIESDLQTFPNSTIKEIHKRIPDVNYKDLQKTIYKMAKDGVIKTSGASKNRTYFMA